MQMQYTHIINNESILGIIRRFCSYIDTRLTEHGTHVAYIIYRMIGKTGQYTDEELRNICFAAQLHDIGAFKTEDVSSMLHFETKDVWNHSFYGYLFIQYFSPLTEFAPAVLLHHTDWHFLKNQENLSRELKDLAQLIHIADRIDVSMSLENRTWQETLHVLNTGIDITFAPHILELASKLKFEGSIHEAWKQDIEYTNFLSRIPLSGEEITGYLKMLVFIIDFRSHYTVTHTITTASISYELGKLISLNDQQLNLILCGALLHDLGKIAIPVEILESPGKLGDEDMAIMRTHVDLTEKIFGGMIDETIARIALRHHEKLNGTGYPRGLTAKDLTTEERLVAIADIISALTGTRSYKESFPKDRIRTILVNMKKQGFLDSYIVDMAVWNLDSILDTTAERCRPVLSIYEKLWKDYDHFLSLRSSREKICFALSIKTPHPLSLWP
ncbi:HD-GYP domain-containing protein [Lacrimispora sp. JR3]|uniref:HD-GYP domain-containing protein n=1 Tax=Lacrimispora sinapis TaxID=3111456 RepID=UPI0037489BA4